MHPVNIFVPDMYNYIFRKGIPMKHDNFNEIHSKIDYLLI